MKVKEVMSIDPACCTPNDTARNVAKMMCDLNVGAIPVVADHQSRSLMGVITDRDLCCRVLAHGLDPSLRQSRNSLPTILLSAVMVRMWRIASA
jgi:signal-transduction protein with cAMP-binding, CBS, and nucleotidyltransferase domain